MNSNLKGTHREKIPSNKTSMLSNKYEYGHLDGWHIKSTLYTRFFLKLKQNFWKNEVVTGKTPFFVIGPFCTLPFNTSEHSLVSDRPVWFGNVTLPILVFSTKNRTPVVSKGFAIFRKFISK